MTNLSFTQWKNNFSVQPTAMAEVQCVVSVYLDFAGELDIVHVVKGLFHCLPQSQNSVISQHQHLHHSQTQAHKDIYKVD